MELYESRQENVTSVPMTGLGQSYQWTTAYTVVVPNLKPADVVIITASAEVTTPWQHGAQVDRQISTEQVYGGPQPSWVGLPGLGENLTLNMHHMAIELTRMATGLTGNVAFSLCLSSASSDATAAENYINLERGNGGIQAAVARG